MKVFPQIGISFDILNGFPGCRVPRTRLVQCQADHGGQANLFRLSGVVTTDDEFQGKHLATCAQQRPLIRGSRASLFVIGVALALTARCSFPQTRQLYRPTRHSRVLLP